MQTSTVAPVSKTPTSRAPRGTKKVAVPSTRLEPLDGSLDPLGPLGESKSDVRVDRPPSPPSKEQSLPIHNHRPSAAAAATTQNAADSTESHGRNDVTSRKRYHVPAQAGGADTLHRQTQPSVSIEQAARPTFDITVGDPHKVGDLTSSHIVYQVRTKVK